MRLSATQKVSFTRAAAKVHAVRAAEAQNAEFARKFMRGMAKLDDCAAKQLVTEIVHAPRITGYLPSSNLRVRIATIEALVDTLHDLFASWAPDIRLITLTWDAGFTYENMPVVDVASMISTAHDAMTRVGLNALCAIEVDALSRPIDGERWRRLIFHVHGACWTAGGAFNARDMAVELAALDGGPSLHHPWRCKPAVITSEPTNWYSTAHLARYMLKANDRVKKRVWRDTLKRHKLLVAPAAEYSPSLAVRFADLHSRASITETVFGVGASGQDQYQRWRNLVAEWEEERSGASLDTTADDACNAWQRIYASATCAPYASYEFGRVTF